MSATHVEKNYERKKERKMKNKTVITININREDWKRLKQIALDRDDTASRIIRGLIRCYLKTEEKTAGCGIARGNHLRKLIKERKKYFLYLDGLKGSGNTDMFSVVPFFRTEFPELNIEEANRILREWMKKDTTIEEREK